MTHWRQYFRPGDFLIIGLASLLTLSLFPRYWNATPPDRAVVRSDGQVVAEVDLAVKKTFSITGPLGATRIEIEPGRARVAADPSPRQYCVLQGWLSRSGDVALCAPNRISLQVLGRDRAYDSLAY